MKRKWSYNVLAAAAAALAFGVTIALPSVAGPASEAGTAPIFSGKSVTRSNAMVLGVDPQRNSITLWQDNGEPVDVVVDPSLGKVKMLQMGDKVEITYSRALLLRANKPGQDAIRKRVDSDVTSRASPGSSMSMHRVAATAEVTNIDRDKRMLTLHGPTRTVTLQASSARMLDGLKVGDTLRVDYVEATAIHITRDGMPLR
ncbi:hypothetical protein [Paraburkholderia rhizosphaerae]|uniref:Copper binding protein CusF n=1 Tax=Paraburkholderia rhizosphaerae TaxID=480658 RepID=A0A4R8LTB4_9BURK|nr:hypothetical protein [Paraburkholderia rhizosphaerae]TDY50933.1 hypothetical protein BX592_108170 [Paraburkholderia rhizosphaerae]